MSRESLSLPRVLRLDSQLVWAPPSAHLTLFPLRPRPCRASTPERETGVGDSFPQPCQGLPRLRAVMTCMSWGLRAPCPQGSTLTPSMAGLLHSADLNPKSVTQALTSLSEEPVTSHPDAMPRGPLWLSGGQHMHSWEPSVSSGPHFESLQNVGPSLCPSETAPHRPNLWLPEFTEEVGMVDGFLD